MSRNLPPLNALRAFEAAGRHQSFSRAAEELGVSHSSISRHVRGLEHRLGQQLFHDLPRGVELSKAGARYLAQVSPAFDLISEATDSFSARAAGQVTLNAEPLMALNWLLPSLGDFYAANPEIDLRLDATPELVNVERYAADIALRYYRFATPDVPHDLVSNAATYPFASPKLIPEPVSDPTELLGYARFRDRRGDTWRDWFRNAGVDTTDLPVETWRMRAQLAYAAALAGHGVILTSADYVMHDVAKGHLIQLSPIGLHEGAYYLIYPEGAVRRRAVRVLRDWILDNSQAFRTSDP